ncbi:unnamed protein product [Larinioides sclopetarius]|uniref:Uncharacterized protein n=1 Tax=Larinioides sclopetarius TaxID=280406 RepID=A0AAV2BQA1_9ARAC
MNDQQNMISDADIKSFFSLVDSKELFAGVFASDQIPFLDPDVEAITFINTGISSTKGQDSVIVGHWLLAHQVNSNTANFFDSFGFPPQFFNEHIVNYFSRYENLFPNKFQFQTFGTQVCGYYVIFVACAIAQGRKGEEKLMELSGNRNRDEYVERVVKEIYEKAVERQELSQRVADLFFEVASDVYQPVLRWISGFEGLTLICAFLCLLLFVLLICFIPEIYGRYDPSDYFNSDTLYEDEMMDIDDSDTLYEDERMDVD